MGIAAGPGIELKESELSFEFVRASGPGGQNVNKVSTAVKLYFDVDGSPSLPPDVKRRLRVLAGRRINRNGILAIDARRFRTQEANRRDALERLLQLIGQAAVAPKTRRPTRPGTAAKARRLDEKKKHAAVKQGRQRTYPGPD
jgi:ribosome-associated protein